MRDEMTPEDAMRELRVSEEVLRRIVAERELRAYRDENRTKFRRDDVARLRRRWSSLLGFSL